MNLNLRQGDIVHFNGKVYEYVIRFKKCGITCDRTIDYSNGEFYDFCGEEEVIITGNIDEVE